MKKVSLFFCVLLCVLLLSGCGYARQVSEMAYVVGVGIDKGENENILLSLQFAKPMALAGKGGDSGGGEEGEKTQENQSTSLVTAEGTDIFSAMAAIESSLSKQINLTHTKILLFSEEIANEGVLKYTESLMGNNQFRPNTYAALARGGAKEYFAKVKPALEQNPAKYYTLMFSKDTKSIVPGATLRDLYFNISTEGQSAVLPVVGSLDESLNGQDNAKTDENKTDSAGMAVFRGDKLAEILMPEEAEIFNIISGNYKEGYFNIKTENRPITVRLKTRCKPKICTKVEKDKFSAEIKIKLSAEALSYDGKTAELSEIVNSDIKKRAEEFIMKNKEIMCDTVGFGKLSKKNFMFFSDWEEFIKQEKFKELMPDIKVETKISGSGLVRAEKQG